MKEIDRLVDEVPQLSKTEQNQIQAQASAQIAEREHAGVWGGTVKAHTAYAHRPLEWITTYLKVPPETLHWSLHPSYQTHRWDGDEDPLVRILTALAEHRDVGVESATGTGKTLVFSLPPQRDCCSMGADRAAASSQYVERDRSSFY